MAEFFGQLERLAADLYPFRWPILAASLVVLFAAAEFGRRMGWHRFIWRHRVRLAIPGVPVLALLIFIAYDLGSPLFINRTVEEEFPFAFSAAIPQEMAMEEVESIMEGMSKVVQNVDEAMPASMTVPTIGRTTITRPSLSPSPTPSEPDAAPTAIKSGEFRDRDAIHRGSGQAIIYRGSDGSHLLRLENLNVTNGPDLHVILTPRRDPDNRAEVMAPGHVNLGQLKGNRGNQNYPIPDSVDAEAQWSAVIYCMPFHVIFSVAALQDGG